MSDRLLNINMRKPLLKKWWFWVVISVIISGLLVVYAYSQQGVSSKKDKIPTNVPTTVISEEDYKYSCDSIDYKTLARNPDKYKGKNYEFTGKVIQVSEQAKSNKVDLRINITKTIGEYTKIESWEDTIYAVIEIPKGADKILEDDVITFWGTCDGDYSYTSVLGNKISLPKIDIKYYELNN